jgi:hypothetical protein
MDRQEHIGYRGAAHGLRVGGVLGRLCRDGEGRACQYGRSHGPWTERRVLVSLRRLYGADHRRAGGLGRAQKDRPAAVFEVELSGHHRGRLRDHAEIGLLALDRADGRIVPAKKESGLSSILVRDGLIEEYPRRGIYE